MTERPWYHEGLRFECTGCGNCCTGEPGYVWVNNAEIEAMAAASDVDDVEHFEKLYVRRIGIRKSLVEFPNGDCVFFDAQSRRCKVYQARPRQCRSWPFWQSNTRSAEAWRQTCEECPGAGSGKLVPLDEIEHQRSLIRI